MRKKKKRIVRTREDILADKIMTAMAAMLKFKGWNPLVSGGMQIEQEGKFRYRFCIKFTGTPPPSKTAKTQSPGGNNER